MKLFGIPILLFVFFFSSESDPVKINWDENKKLTWSDFKAQPSEGADYVASTSSGISFSYSYKLLEEKLTYDFTVQSYFYPEESWYKEAYVSEYILKHEQTHFDISELHARILRKRISEASFSKAIKKEMKAIYQKVEGERQTMQNLFDSESEHSKNKEKEYQWEQYVTKQLNVYESFK
ncbi:DUF922 domain-containing protein [Ulvibacter litoralis]|uniref:DUF922 domain-containing protein n=1 Tax=Ulvibacter litoralis TaxID=227084 RepID=A0A1G7HZ15_9FLAO|nr:hypothetical protein [Ulvibacter litoralis]GHC63038.1 hypothetical protein GCM10008083_30440 [Ulvibacter litoralis]SDF05598.1 hypothetical protein SAMN05421855_1057 [Ulvibacter litoralis]